MLVFEIAVNPRFGGTDHFGQFLKGKGFETQAVDQLHTVFQYFPAELCVLRITKEEPFIHLYAKLVLHVNFPALGACCKTTESNLYFL